MRFGVKRESKFNEQREMEMEEGASPLRCCFIVAKTVGVLCRDQ